MITVAVITAHASA